MPHLNKYKDTKLVKSELNIILITEMGIFNELIRKKIKFNPRPLSEKEKIDKTKVKSGHKIEKKQSEKDRNLVDFHLEIVKKIDALIAEHEKEAVPEEIDSTSQEQLEELVELREPLKRKLGRTDIQSKNIFDYLDFENESFKAELTDKTNPSFKFVKNLEEPKDIVYIKKIENKNVKDDDSLSRMLGGLDKANQKSAMGFAHIKVRSRGERAKRKDAVKKPRQTSSSQNIKNVREKKETNNVNGFTLVKEELEETKKEIEEKKKELELAEKRAKEGAEELKEKKKEKLEKEKEEKKLKKLELKKAKMEEREREKKLRKEAKIEEKKKILEAKMALKESNRKNNENAELEKKKEEIETINGQLNTKEELIRQLQTELEDRNNNLESTSNELNKKEEEMTRLQTDLQQKTAELEKKELEEAEELKRKERERSEREKEEKKIKKMELKKAKMEAKERERELRKKAKIEEKKTRLEAKNSLKERKELENKISEENPEFKDETFEQKEGTTLEEKPGEKITSIDRDVKIDIFRDIKSIDEETAVLLHNGGFTSIDAVSKASLKDLIRIGKIEKKLAKNVKREIEQKLEESSTKTEEEPGEYFILDEGFDEGDAKKIDENISKHKFVEEDKDFFGEEDEVNKENKKIDVFKDINNIDEKTASLLYENGITSVDILREKSVRELTRIKGIRRKLAKRIKKEIEDMDRKTEDMKEYDEKSAHDIKDEPFVEEKAHDEEWESYGTDEMQKQGYTYEDYTLYKKKIETKSGKKRLVRFFSKAEPEEGEPSELPTGFEVKVNKKTGLPYLKKKK